MTMPSSTKSTADSATFCTPVGTSCLLAAAEVNITAKAMAAETHMRMTTLFTANGAAAEEVGPLDDVGDGRELETEDHETTASLSAVGLRPGKASEADT